MALFIAVSVAGVGAVAIVAVGRDDPKFCSLEGLIGDDGQIYGRDPYQDCQFVDEDGTVLPVDGIGNAILPD